MTNHSALDTLIELATNATDEAAKRLGLAIRSNDDAAQKLALLLQYRDDYNSRFKANLASGLSASGYRNFQLFLGKLDDAITGQQKIVQEADRHVVEERTAWQTSERKRMSYDTLATRAHKEEQRQENRRDQKLMDEHAARSALTKR